MTEGRKKEKQSAKSEWQVRRSESECPAMILSKSSLIVVITTLKQHDEEEVRLNLGHNRRQQQRRTYKRYLLQISNQLWLHLILLDSIVGATSTCNRKCAAMLARGTCVTCSRRSPFLVSSNQLVPCPRVWLVTLINLLVFSSVVSFELCQLIVCFCLSR